MTFWLGFWIGGTLGVFIMAAMNFARSEEQ
jgi:hypothetical protein